MASFTRRVHRGDAGRRGDGSRSSGRWLDQDASQFHWIGLEPHSISVGTARADVVEILLRVHQKLPPLVLEAEHVLRRISR
jgi:hypothetical protein